MILILSYVRLIYAVPLFILNTLVSSLLCILFGIFKVTRPLQDFTVYLWAKLTLVLFGARIEVRGLENAPKNEGYLILINHTSWFDIFAIYTAFPSSRFGAKIELFKIPIFGLAIRFAGALPIARKSREEVFKVYKEAEPKMRAGQIYNLAPEGTRQLTEELGPFKTGPFIFAINTKVKILPVVIQGASLIMPKNSYWVNIGAWSRTITLSILPTVNAAEYTIEERPQIQERVRELMKNELDRLKN